MCIRLKSLILAWASRIFTNKVVNHFANWHVFSWSLVTAPTKHCLETRNDVLAVVASSTISAVMVKLIAYLRTAAEREVIVHLDVQRISILY